MRLHCLGTVGYHPNGSRHTSCYALPDSGIVLDAGSGIFRLGPLIRTEGLDIVLSHAHLDHVLGLTVLLSVLHRHPVRRLSIWGEAEKLEAVQRHLFSDLLFPVRLRAEWKALDGRDSVRLGCGAELTWRRQTHPGGSLAYRLAWPPGVFGGSRRGTADGGLSAGKTLVYATDTAGDHDASTLAWMSGSDLLMHECSFGEGGEAWAERTGHTWTGRLAEIAAATQPRALLITHLGPEHEAEPPPGVGAIRGRTSGRVVVATDGLAIDF